MTRAGPVELDGRSIDPDLFHDQIVPGNRPVVLRGLVADWPAVQAARRGHAALVGYVRQFDRGDPLTVKMAAPETRGVFSYDAAMTGMNFTKPRMPLSDALDLLLAVSGQADPPAIAVQSKPVVVHLPGFAAENRLALVPDGHDMRVWIGNASTVGTHYDQSENIACVVAGRRRFTLFPPDQAANLYQGPFELTPARPVSLVDLARPDLDRYPRFADALAHALVVELGPGDALYLPYLWWHGVEALQPVNMLVNFWWTGDEATYGSPMAAMLYAMMSVKNLAPARRAAWRAMFDHFVFEDQGPPGLHLPADHRGVQGAMTLDQARRIRDEIIRSLDEGDSGPQPLTVRLRSKAGAALKMFRDRRGT